MTISQLPLIPFDVDCLLALLNLISQKTVFISNGVILNLLLADEKKKIGNYLSMVQSDKIHFEIPQSIFRLHQRSVRRFHLSERTQPLGFGVVGVCVISSVSHIA
jgi:hypothetical protein